MSLDRSGLDTPNWIALGFLVAGVFTGIRPLWPVRDPSASALGPLVVRRIPHIGNWLAEVLGLRLVWQAHLRVDEVRALDEPEISDLRLRVAEELDAHSRQNGLIINRRSRWVILASLSLFGQVLAWSVALAS